MNRPLVYLCHPFATDPTENTQRLRRLCRQALAAGYLPIAPPLYLPTFINEATEGEEAMALRLQLVGLCQEMWVFTDNGLSEDMCRELKVAQGWFDATLRIHFLSDRQLPDSRGVR